ncbi:DNA translocase FtsK [Sandaracinus amylolyticus]|uniref:DNA translocase FtsK n=1 Tax=Sandaracinus amylolyticus TaxID=927083 RepID=UPI003AF365EB
MELVLRRVAVKNADDRRSARLFAFVFGRTLEGLVHGGPGARVSLAIDPELVRIDADRLRASREESGEIEAGWSPLVLELLHRGAASPLRRVEWRPLDQTGLIALAAIVESDHEAWISSHESFEAWCRHILEVLSAPSDAENDPEPPLLDGGQEVLAGDPVLEVWRGIRAEHLQRLRNTGISAEALSEYVDQWRDQVLGQALTVLVPSGAPLQALSSFLTCDTFRDASGRVTLLATHPLRARWVACHLGETGKRLQRLLDDGVVLNPINDGFYFESLAQLSPHEQPPILTADEKLFVSVREESWHEHYATLRRPDRADDDWLSELDDASIDELARVVEEYVVAHPHKADGISILLLVRSGGARVLRRLARRAFRTNTAPKRVHLHVYAPREEAAAIERSLAEFDDPDQRSESNSPLLDVVVHVWPDGHAVVPSLADFGDNVDLALVPNLFGSHTRAQETTRKGGDDIGSRFDPWFDAPTHIDNTATGRAENVSRVLLPRRPDAVLEHWSTLSVRGFRHNVVGSDIDYVMLQVRFDRSRQLFDELHRVARWVVTLDAFIGRDQIEALPRQPDVITVRPDVGKSQAYTLIVSSSSGRAFVVDRLQHRLEADLPHELRPRARPVAEKLYESSRFLAPGILLRALGLGWAVQELVGLAIARRLVDERIPVLAAEGFLAWVSLDEHSHWFGAGRRSRADLARIAFLRGPDGRIRLQVLVVEAKFRDQAAVSTADDQVKNTRELLQHALMPQRTADPRIVDLDFWRREILGAIEQLPKGGERTTRSISSWSADGSDAGGVVPVLAREDWIRGDYDFEEVACIVCTTSPSESVTDPIQRTPGGHLWYRVGREELARIIGAIGGSTPATAGPAMPTGTPSGAPPVPEGGASPSASSPIVAVEPAISRDAPSPPAPDAIRSTPRTRGRSTAELESRYQRVLDVFGEFRIGVTRPAAEAYREGPGFYVFRVQPAPGVRPDTVRGYADEVKLKLELQADAVPRSYIDRGCVVFEVPKPDHERYFVDAETLWQRSTFDDSRLNAPIGEDIKGDVVEIDFSSDVSPHLLIAGQTGAGKSIALETILLGLTRHRNPSRLRLGLVDPKTTELVAFENSPHLLRPIGWDPKDAIDLLEGAVAEMERRRDIFRAQRTRSLPEYNARVADRPDEVLPWWVVVLDEYADLTSDKNDKRRIEESLQRLSAKARASGIHVVVATQRPSADVISTVVRSNLVAQLALRVRSAVESNIVMAEAGAEALAGKGDAFFKNAQRIVRVQCAKVRSP